MKRSAWIFEWAAGSVSEGAVVPFGDGGNEFGDGYAGVGLEGFEGSRECEAHAQAADEDLCVGAGGDGLAAAFAEGVFGSVHARAHEFDIVDADYDVLAALVQGHESVIVGEFGFSEEDPGQHFFTFRGSLVTVTETGAGLVGCGGMRSWLGLDQVVRSVG